MDCETGFKKEIVFLMIGIEKRHVTRQYVCAIAGCSFKFVFNFQPMVVEGDSLIFQRPERHIFGVVSNTKEHGVNYKNLKDCYEIGNS